MALKSAHSQLRSVSKLKALFKHSPLFAQQNSEMQRWTTSLRNIFSLTLTMILHISWEGNPQACESKEEEAAGQAPKNR
jgi:hypothetical protein